MATLKLQTAYPNGIWPTEFVKSWAFWVEQRTQGRLKIEVFEVGTFCDVPLIIDNLGKGLFEVAATYGANNAHILPVGDIESGLPMAWTQGDPSVPWDAYYTRGLEKVIRGAYATKNVYHIPMFGNDWYQVGTTSLVTKLEELKGKRIRALGSYGDFLIKLGASPVPLAWDATYMAVKSGAIDGALASLISFDPVGMWELCKYYLMPSMNCTVSNLSFNMDTLNALPADIRDIILKETPGYMLILTTKLGPRNYTAAKYAREKYGAKIVYLSDRDVSTMRKAAVGIWDAVATKDSYCRKAVDIVKEQLWDYGLLQAD